MKIKLQPHQIWKMLKISPRPDSWIKFWKRVNRSCDFNQCWEWTGGRQVAGYGCFYDKGKTYLAHRIICIWLYGDLDGLDIDHLVCNNPPCVNPLHLIPTSHLNNIARGSSPPAINARKSHCIRGHKFSLNPDGTKRKCTECAKA